nr:MULTISPECIES: SDR family oxidoreductase [Rhodococcus]
MLVGVIRSGQIQRPALEAGRDVEEYLHTMADRMRIPLGRVGEAHEFGDTAAFLLSPRAGYITGIAVHVDGGHCHAIRQRVAEPVDVPLPSSIPGEKTHRPANAGLPTIPTVASPLPVIVVSVE